MEKIEDFKEFNHCLDRFGYQKTSSSSLFHIYGLEWNHNKGRGFETPLFRQHFFDISLFLSADINYRYAHFQDRLIDSTLQLVPPRQLQKIVADSVALKNLKGYTINFKPEFLSFHFDNVNFIKDFPFFTYSNSDVLLRLTRSDLQEVLNLFEKIHHLYLKQNSYSHHIIEGYLWALLYTIKKIWIENRKRIDRIDVKSSLVTRFELEVNERLDAKMQISDFADIFCMTPKYLSETVKASCGQSAREIKESALLVKAKSLLAQTDSSISEIAYQLGYSDHSSFSRFFKRVSGTSPSTFRKKP